MQALLTIALAAGCREAPHALLATPDAGIGDAGTFAPDAPADSGTADAADAVDAGATDGGCGACAPPPCHRARCEGGRCLDEPLDDGARCDELGASVCVDAACVLRTGCGDGYREPGPVPAREACDDGNVATGDACSAACEPVPLVVASRPGGDDLAPGPSPAAAVDARGRTLFVWTESDSGRVLARRATRAGVLVGDAFPIGEGSQPSVAGLEHGWAVAWASDDVFVRVVQPDGAMSGARRVNTTLAERQHEPALARLGEGFVVAWTDESTIADGASSRIVARAFGPDAATETGEIEISDTRALHAEPAIAAHPSGVAIAWTDAGEIVGAIPIVRARRLDRALSPLDERPIAIGAGFEPSIASAGGYAIAWTARSEDGWGDVRAAALPLDGEPLEGLAIAATLGRPERLPSIATLGATAIAVHALGTGVTGRLLDGALAYGSGALGPEAEDLDTLLHASGEQTALSISPARDGVWVVWSDSSDPRDEGARRAVVAQYLRAP
jgi:cysteine-rich repeat protein